MDRLCILLEQAARIIREQGALLTEHGIDTDSGALERARTKLLEDIENSV